MLFGDNLAWDFPFEDDIDLRKNTHLNGDFSGVGSKLMKPARGLCPKRRRDDISYNDRIRNLLCKGKSLTGSLIIRKTGSLDKIEQDCIRC